jgi:hypothetical protein
MPWPSSLALSDWSRAPQIPREGCSPHPDKPSEHQKPSIYGALRQITPPKKLHKKGQFPTLYSVFWLVAPPSHGMRGQEFCPSSFSKLSLHFVLPPVLPPPIIRPFYTQGPKHGLFRTHRLLMPSEHRSNVDAI